MKNNYEWNLSPLLDKEGEQGFIKQRKVWEKATLDFVKKYKGKKDYLSDPIKLRSALEDYEAWRKDYGLENNEHYYYYLKTMQDQASPEYKAKFNSVENFSKEIENKMQFFILSLGKIKPEDQKIFLDSKELVKYKHFLEKIFARSKYMLSDKEEKIMNLKESSSYSYWNQMFSSILSKQEKQVLDENKKKSFKTYNEMLSLMKNKDQEIRDSSAKAFNEILEELSDIAEAEINAIFNDKKVNDELRGYDRPDKSRHIHDDIDTEIIDTLIEVVTKNFNISEDHYKLKAKLLGKDKLEYHERNVEYGNITKKYSYEEAIDLIKKVFSSLDKDFLEILENFIKNNQIDVFPRIGKRGGAFCVHALITQPTYILLNHTNTLNDVLTIAHELGHGINNELIRKSQNSLYFGTPLSTAEVASTFFEDFVLQELLKTADDETRFSLMIQKLDSDISTINRQISCYKFEQELHKKFREKTYLSKQDIGEIFQDNMKQYMGEYVLQSKGSENWWIYWMHIRTYFYVYSYASGLLISKAMQNLVKQDKNNIIKIKRFLSTGYSKSPKETFSDLGIDITDKSFFEKGMDEVNLLLKDTEDLAKKLGKVQI